MRKSLNALIAWLLIPVLGVATACSSASIADLTNVLGTQAANIAKLEGNPALSAKLITDTAAAVAAIDSWKSGSPATEAIEALNLVAADLNLLPVNPKYAPLVDLAIGTVESILAILPSSGTNAHVLRHAPLSNPPKTAKEFKARWNALAPDAASKIK